MYGSNPESARRTTSSPSLGAARTLTPPAPPLTEISGRRVTDALATRLELFWSERDVAWETRVVLGEGHVVCLRARDAVEPVESFCVFYPQLWAGDVLNGLVRSDDDLLANPYDASQHVMFYEIPHQHDSLVTPLMRRLMQLHQSGVAAAGLDHGLRIR